MLSASDSVFNYSLYKDELSNATRSMQADTTGPNEGIYEVLAYTKQLSIIIY